LTVGLPFGTPHDRGLTTTGQYPSVGLQPPGWSHLMKNHVK